MRYGFPDQIGVVDQFSGMHLFTCLDLKAGFLNIIVTENTMLYLGVVTQDGTHRYKRLPFGLHDAPLFF